MAALTATSTIQHSVGDMTLLIVGVTIGSTSDTYTISSSAPVLAYWINGISGETVTYSAGTFTMTNSSGTGACQLFILLGGC